MFFGLGLGLRLVPGVVLALGFIIGLVLALGFVFGRVRRLVMGRGLHLCLVTCLVLDPFPVFRFWVRVSALLLFMLLVLFLLLLLVGVIVP